MWSGGQRRSPGGACDGDQHITAAFGKGAEGHHEEKGGGLVAKKRGCILLKRMRAVEKI